MLASCLSCAYPSDGSLAQDVALELCDSAENRIEHFAGGRRRVDVFGQRSQRHVALVERLGDFEQVAQRASEPIKFPHDEGVAGAQAGECAIHLWSRAQSATELVLENSLAAGGLERVKLQAGRLFVGRDSRVADEAGFRRLRYIGVPRATGNPLLRLPRNRFFG